MFGTDQVKCEQGDATSATNPKTSGFSCAAACFRSSPLSLAVRQCGGALVLTSDSSPAQCSVLSQDSAYGVLVVVQCHGPLGAEPLLVVPHEGAVADLGSWRKWKRHDRSKTSVYTAHSKAAVQDVTRVSVCVCLGSELVDCIVQT